MSDSAAHTFKICPVSSAVDFTEFQKFVRRLANQHGGCRITPCAKKDCNTPCSDSGYGSMQLEFGSRFGPKLSSEESRRLKGFMDAAFGKKRPDHGMKEILIENDRFILDLTASKNISSTGGKLMIELVSTKSTFAQPTAGHVIPLYEGFFIDEHRRLVMDLKDSREFSIEGAKLVISLVSQEEKQSQHTQDAIRKRWLSGKYSSRDLCAEVGCKDHKISFSTAREALRNMPEPCR